ncbi:MAG: DUF427 domain-containing protein [Actinomycetota bacterium]|nr:DUF427 domain-containing protein [Actinomycetota bacterium]
MRAVWDGAVLAESDETVVVDGNHYFPPESLNRELLVPSAKRTWCPWKGRAGYYSLRVGGRVNDDAAWSYADPRPAAAEIRDHVAFWRGVEVRA